MPDRCRRRLRSDGIGAFALIPQITCPSHEVSQEKKDGGVVVRLEREGGLEGDMVLMINGPANKPALWVENDSETLVLSLSNAEHGVPQAALVTFFPTLEGEQYEICEMIFLCDRSGSMRREGRMQQAKDALQLFLRSLPPSCTFNGECCSPNDSMQCTDSAPASNLCSRRAEFMTTSP